MALTDLARAKEEQEKKHEKKLTKAAEAAGDRDKTLADRDAPDFTGAGTPWIWLKRVVGDAVVATPLAPRGRLADALTPATAIFEDPRVEAARAANPSDVDRP